MEQPLTPPPSFRVLRVRTRPRPRTISDENKCGRIAPVGIKEQFPVPRKEPSPVRGRTRSRIMRNGLALNTNFARPHVPIGLPTCCPPSLPSHVEPGIDDDLIFSMSPVQTHSPTLQNFDLAVEARADANPNRVKQSTAHTLSAMWEKHKTYLTGAASQPHTPRTPGSKRPRAGSHQRGFSDTHAIVFPRRPRFSDQRFQQGSKPLLDLLPTLDAPLEPPSPPAEDLFMYSFPSFNSSPLAKARQARAHRQASKTPVQGEFLTGNLESEPNACGKNTLSNVKVESEPKQRLGPIRARKLRIQSGETLSDDLDDANYISHAFKSASLDPEKESDLDDTESFDTVYFSSQRSSSISSSSTDAASLDQSIGRTSSILASFPVRRSTRSRTHSSSRSREHSSRRSPSKVDPEVNATAMMTRGRASRRASAEVRQQVPSEYIGGDRRGRGRTPPRQRRVGDDGRTFANRTNVR